MKAFTVLVLGAILAFGSTVHAADQNQNQNQKQKQKQNQGQDKSQKPEKQSKPSPAETGAAVGRAMEAGPIIDAPKVPPMRSLPGSGFSEGDKTQY